MARDWVVDGQPGDPAERFDSKKGKYYANPKINDTFNWTPTNQCPVNMEEQDRYDKFKDALEALTNDDLIYCDYTVTMDKDPNENKLDPPKVVRSIAPFGFLIEVDDDDTAYLVMRGTQNEYDGKLDFESSVSVVLVVPSVLMVNTLLEFNVRESCSLITLSRLNRCELSVKLNTAPLLSLMANNEFSPKYDTCSFRAITNSSLSYSVAVGVLISKFPLNEIAVTSLRLFMSRCSDTLDCLLLRSCVVYLYGVSDLRV